MHNRPVGVRIVAAAIDSFLESQILIVAIDHRRIAVERQLESIQAAFTPNDFRYVNALKSYH